ncbi:hypothetical protein HCN44_007679 [Aphidius gifuensis]|uniref:Cathepsin L n=2 Tax=Aphidius gifuensis TaxID=684658 RepID=A0A834XJQ8_APHGI|nr:hypothetical protein HCN44_007679 [Aphidius gifuensis]
MIFGSSESQAFFNFENEAKSLIHQEWKSFQLEYNKNYETPIEKKYRMKVFMHNKGLIAKHNARYALNKTSFKLELNKFGDLLRYDFVNRMNGFNRSTINRNKLLGKPDEPVPAHFVPPANVDYPTNVDWRKLGAVTSVKDQGQCGSCWAFSTTGALEGQHFREKGYLVSLSEQNLIDCSSDYGNDGCNGGLMDNAFEYIKDNRGIDNEKSYEYEARQGKCRYNKKSSVADDAGFVDIANNDEKQLMQAVATVGPISVAIDASHHSFQFYSQGVYDEPDCSTTELDHGVLVVGYGTDSDTGKDYWLVKNSWGENWGEKGYIKMSRNKNNQCGIASSASYPLV